MGRYWFTIRIVLVAALGYCSAGVQAQQWRPKGPVHVIVPFDAGSTPDLLARTLGPRVGRVD